MSVDFYSLPHQGVQQLKPYKPGKSKAELAKEQGLSQIIKLASNENPLGCSAHVLKTIAAQSAETIAGYPSPYLHPIMAALARHLGVEENQLIISNGSDYIFGLLLIAFALHRGKHLLTHDYAFSTYQIQAHTLGIPVRSVPVGHDWQVCIDSLIQASSEDTALICLANPNNPTGLMIATEDLKKLLDQVPATTLVVIDEAYYEFLNQEQPYDSIPWLAHYPNLVLTRTFSKIYGLAGLRLGYAMANPAIIDILKRIQLPFTINQLAMAAGRAALEDQDFVEQTLAVTRAGKAQLAQGLNELGLSFLPSMGNFFTFDCGRDSTPIFEYLLSKGVIVRPLHPYQMPNHLRVSVGTKCQNELFLTALQGALS